MRPMKVVVLAALLAVSSWPLSAQDRAPEERGMAHVHSGPAAHHPASEVAPAHGKKRRAVGVPGGSAPSAQADTYTVVRGQTLTVAAASGVLANDTDPHSAALTAVLLTTTAHGALALSADGSFSYTNDGSDAASDQFTYKANNGSADSGAATVTIAVTTAATAPAAADDAWPTMRGQTLTVTAPGVLANDTPNGGAIASYGAPAGTEQTTLGNATPTTQSGSVRLTADGAFTYTPGNGFTGIDIFKYVLANDGGTSAAQVAITVTPPAPAAAADSYTATVNTALNVAAPGVLQNDTLNEATIVSYGTAGTEQTSIGSNTSLAHGTLKLNANGSFTYTPASSFNGTDNFKYILQNPSGSATGSVKIEVVDFIVNAPGFFYTFTGVAGQNPLITLKRGRTYRFKVDAPAAHPFEILFAPDGSVTNNNIAQGILTFAVPNADQSYQYHCSIHDFGNTINTIP